MAIIPWPRRSTSLRPVAQYYRRWCRANRPNRRRIVSPLALPAVAVRWPLSVLRILAPSRATSIAFPARTVQARTNAQG